MVSFYRGVWCPYCNLDLQALQESLPGLTAQGAQLDAKSQPDNKLTFPILSDRGMRSRPDSAYASSYPTT